MKEGRFLSSFLGEEETSSIVERKEFGMGEVDWRRSLNCVCGREVGEEIQPPQLTSLMNLGRQEGHTQGGDLVLI